MEQTRITFGEWLPDQPTLLGVLQDAKNVRPTSTGYTYFNEVSEISASASQNLLSLSVGKFGGSTQVFAGGATRLFKLDSSDGSLDDVSKGGSAYTSTDRWSFTQFGTKLLAVNKHDKVQAWTIGSSSAFADLDSSAPTAYYITTVRDFVVCARDSSNPSKVFWSDINDETDWTPATTSQSDTQVIPDGGNIVGVTGGEFGLILMDRAIHRMTYVGSPFYFQFDNISRGIGCFAEGSIAQYGQVTFFLGGDGFYMCNGTTLTPIGSQKVDRFFFEDANLSDDSTLSCAIDPENKLVVWAYLSNSGEKTLLIYNWQVQRWSRAITTATALGTSATSSTTLEGVDGYNNNLDNLTISLDSRFWLGGSYALQGVKDTKLVAFTGAKSTAELITGDIDLKSNSTITLARPIVENGSGSVAIASRVAPTDNVTFSTLATSSTENRVPLRGVGRLHRIKMQPTGDNWETVVGVDLELKRLGNR